MNKIKVDFNKIKVLFFIIWIISVHLTCKKKTSEKENIINHNLVKFHLKLKPEEQISNDKLNNDKHTILKRLEHIQDIIKPQINNKNILQFYVSPTTVRRELLNDLSNLIYFKTPLKIRYLAPFDNQIHQKIKKILTSKNIKAIEFKKLGKYEFLGSLDKKDLENFVFKYFPTINWYLYREEIGVKDFSGSFWYALPLNSEIKFKEIMYNNSQIGFKLFLGTQKQGLLALILDHRVIAVQKIKKVLTSKQDYGRIKYSIIKIISNSSKLNVSWSIARVEVEQNL